VPWCERRRKAAAETLAIMGIVEPPKVSALVDIAGELSAGVSLAGEIRLTEVFAYREWSRWGSSSPKGE
jgi:hypothetical protein